MPACSRREGRAVVFESLEDLARANETCRTSTSTTDDFLVLKNAGPRSAAGHAGGGLSADPEEAGEEPA